MDSIILPSNLNVSDVFYSPPRTLDNGGRAIYMSLNKSPIVLQTPEMIAPYGVNNWNDDGKGPDKYSLDLSFVGKDSRENLSLFFDKMKTLDKKLIEDGFQNSMTWLKKTFKTVDVVEALYTPMIKYAKDKATGEITDKYPPTFKLKIPHTNNNFQCEVYDTKRNTLNMKELIDSGVMKGAKVTAIIQCLGIWVAGGKYGCSWKVLQMRVSLPQKIKGYAFKDIEDDKIDDSDLNDDDDDETDDEKTKDILNHATEEVGNLNIDDDLIESSEDELEAPVKEVTKKKVVKK
jgi:hypothetical protein